jgi:branched-chain amino acid transport system substrate-binding protein
MQVSLLVRACLAVLTATSPLVGHTQEKEPIKVGIIYDLTGPFAEGGSVDGAIGTDIAIEMINERGGVAGRPVVPIVAAAKQGRSRDQRGRAALGERGS